MLRRLARLINVVWVLGRYDAILPKELHAAMPPAIRFFAGILRIGAKSKTDLGDRLSIALVKLGPVWIKFGQLLATRPDIVGIDAANALCGLKDNVKPFPTSKAIEIIKAEFEGINIDEVFGDLGDVIASASVAQVYKVKNNQALKILRPEAAATIKSDIAALGLAAKIVMFVSKKSRRLEPIKLVDTLAKSLEIETDFRREAGAADAFRQIAEIDGYLSAPIVDWNYSGKTVLCTSWINGKPLTNKDALIGKDRKSLADAVTRGFLASALEYGFFHADMHEGNLMIGDDGKLYAVDFGIMGRIGKTEQRYLAEILYCFLNRDYRGAARVHFTAGYVPKTFDEGEFGIALRSVAEPIFGRKAKDVSMGKVLLQLFEVTEQFGMKLRPELVLLQKTMVQVEGVARSIDEDHDIWESSRPVVERFMKREIGLEGIINRGIEDFEKLSYAVKRLPSLVTELEDFLAKNKK